MNVLSISHVRQYKKNIFENLGHAWFPIHFSARGGGFGQGGVGGGIPDDSIMTIGLNKLGLSCAKLSNA